MSEGYPGRLEPPKAKWDKMRIVGIVALISALSAAVYFGPFSHPLGATNPNIPACPIKTMPDGSGVYQRLSVDCKICEAYKDSQGIWQLNTEHCSA
jgi:hypothetical protein